VSVPADTGLVVGVDTHLDTHTAALCDARGRALAQLQVPADPAVTPLWWPGPVRPLRAVSCSGRWKVPATTGWAWPGT